MIMKSIVVGALLSACAIAAMPLSAHAADNYGDAVRKGEITSGRSNEAPGGLTARDVMGKRLLDSDGNVIGTIEKVSPDGQTVIIRPGSGKPITEDMASLSLGMGANTVIKQSASEADALNTRNAAMARKEAESDAQAKTATTSETTRYAPSTVTTSATTVERTQN